MSLPNILTYARIAAIPVVVGCVFWQSIMDGPLWLRWVALAVFISAGVTDFLDGYYARIWHQHSAFGRMLDPIADKLLVASCLLMLAADGIIHGWTLWAAIVILCREILVSGLREYLAALGQPTDQVVHGTHARRRLDGFLRLADPLAHPGKILDLHPSSSWMR